MSGDQRSHHVDVLIIGAGLSGIAAACYLKARCPTKSFAILEERHAIGGTWDLFRYPGIRSDSDMYSLGYSFRPWRSDKAMADGPLILRYLQDTVAEHEIEGAIRFGHRATRASWSSADALWTVEAEAGPQRRLVRFSCGFLFVCSGYYDHDAGYRPDWPGTDRFAGRIVHPQHWPDDLDHAGRHVIVIGSGATAVTLVPELARTATHVTMLQRSPTYVVSLPGRDAVAASLHRLLPGRVAHRLARWKNVLLTMFFYTLARRRPDFTKRKILGAVRKELGPDYDVRRHFTPTYKPWDQRLCFAQDGDLFAAIRTGNASIVTGEIDTFTETGLRLRSGERLDADLIVTATGLNIKVAGGIELTVDGARVDPAKALLYKGMMLSEVPNLAVAVGYTNASWTLKCELTARYVCRLLNHMDARGYAWCMPQRRDASIREEPAIGLTSGYVRRALAILPKQGTRKPWRLHQNYVLDTMAVRLGAVEDGTMAFGRSSPGSLPEGQLREWVRP